MNMKIEYNAHDLNKFLGNVNNYTVPINGIFSEISVY